MYRELTAITLSAALGSASFAAPPSPYPGGPQGSASGAESRDAYGYQTGEASRSGQSRSAGATTGAQGGGSGYQSDDPRQARGTSGSAGGMQAEGDRQGGTAGLQAGAGSRGGTDAQSTVGPEKHFSGRITELRTVPINPQGDMHLLGKIRLDSGREGLVNLGTIESLRAQDTRLQRGQRIEGSGSTGRLNDRPVLVVYRFATDRGSYEGNPDPRTRGNTVVSGRIDDMRDVRLQGIPDKHQLVRLRSTSRAGGRHVVVDLGSGKGFQDLNLQQGDLVMAYGPKAAINGKPVVYAEQVAELVSLDREGLDAHLGAGASSEQQQKRQQSR